MVFEKLNEFIKENSLKIVIIEKETYEEPEFRFSAYLKDSLQCLVMVNCGSFDVFKQGNGKTEEEAVEMLNGFLERQTLVFRSSANRGKIHVYYHGEKEDEKIKFGN